MWTSGWWVLIVGVLVSFGLGLGGLILAHRVFWLAVMFAVFLVAGSSFGVSHLFFIEREWAKRRKARAKEAAHEAWAAFEKARAAAKVPVVCPQCQKRVRCPISLIGETVCCSACTSRFTARDEFSAESEEEKAPTPVPLRKNLRSMRWVIAMAAFCVLAVGGLEVLLASRKQSEPKRELQEEPALNEKQKAAAMDAIKALGRIEAATEVGVNYQQYGQLVIDAKAVVNEAERILPAGSLLTNLREAMDAYRDAGRDWDRKIRYSSLTFEESMQWNWRSGANKLAKARRLL
jgi:hypothetical protein